MSEAQQEQPAFTLTLAVTDWQLVQQVLQQALAPYVRLSQVMQDMQRQGMAQQMRNNPGPAPDAQAGQQGAMQQGHAAYNQIHQALP